MANSTLSAIRDKVRRITRSPSESQLPTAALDEYVNTFIQYDIPEHLRLFSLRTTFTFYTNIGQDAYPTDTLSFNGITNNVLYNFKNRYITSHEPFYIAGYRSLLSQSREQFFGIYPFINTLINTGLTGDGVTLTFTGTINPPGGVAGTVLLQDKVALTSIDTAGTSIVMVDRPLIDPQYGTNLPNGNLFQPTMVPIARPALLDATNTVNYQTGVFTVTFASAPGNGIPIIADVVPTITALPQAVLYYDNTFIVRPVPDDAYPILFEAYIRPTELLQAGTVPDLEQWWQYIAYGAAKKVFEDRMDQESVQLIMPEFKMQERMVLRRTIVQQTNERTATIYTENIAGAFGPGWWPGGGNL